MKILKSWQVAAFLLLTSAIQSQSEGISVNTLLDTYETHSVDSEFWAHNNERSQTIVRSGEYLGAKIMEKLHRSIEEKSKGVRIFVTFGAGLANYKFQTANAIMFGHEQAHFAMADHLGLKEHHFRSTHTGQEFSFTKGYLNTLFRGGPGGPAVSAGTYDPSIPARERINISMSGLNWQMNYSEDWVQRNMDAKGLSVFTFPGFLTNRSHTLRYTLQDMNADVTAVPGDMHKIAYHYFLEGYSDDPMEEIVKYSLIANILSPAYWRYFQSMNDLVNHGDMQSRDPFFDFAGLRLNWDIPHYFNVDGMTLAPAVYLDTDYGVIGFQVEDAVIGAVEPEYTASISTSYQNYYGSIYYSFNDADGSHIEARAGYSYSDELDIELRHMSSKGDTLKGSRNNYTDESLTYMGVNIRF